MFSRTFSYPGKKFENNTQWIVINTNTTEHKHQAGKYIIFYFSLCFSRLSGPYTHMSVCVQECDRSRVSANINTAIAYCAFLY